jgi:CubicO group peptidase (beta-lactamase class C family)
MSARIAYVPSSTSWETVDPASVGWDPVGLQAALDFAGQRSSLAMTMLLGGRVLAQQSWRRGPAVATDIASAQKSVVALLVGNLAAAGKLEINEPVATYLGPSWSQATPAQAAPITVRDLLTMTSGLSARLTFEATPGSRWFYNTNAYQQLVPLVEAVTGTTIDAVTRAEVFDPIGVSTASLWRDRRMNGPFGIDPNGRRIQALVMTTHDMARVGLLVQRHGEWGSTRVLADPRFLEAATNTSQELNPSYGYLWWLNGKSAHVLPGPPRRRPGPLIPAAPTDLVAALGAADQKIYVSRALDLVVTRTGTMAGARARAALSDFDGELWRRITAAAPVGG